MNYAHAFYRGNVIGYLSMTNQILKLLHVEKKQTRRSNKILVILFLLYHALFTVHKYILKTCTHIHMKVFTACELNVYVYDRLIFQNTKVNVNLGKWNKKNQFYERNNSRKGFSINI